MDIAKLLDENIIPDVQAFINEVGMTISYKEFDKVATGEISGPYDEKITKIYKIPKEIKCLLKYEPNEQELLMIGAGQSIDMIAIFSKKELVEKNAIISLYDLFSYLNDEFDVMRIVPVGGAVDKWILSKVFLKKAKK